MINDVILCELREQYYRSLSTRRVSSVYIILNINTGDRIAWVYIGKL